MPESIELMRAVDETRARACCWREWEFWLLAALALVLYGARLTAVPIHGEETRRAQVAWEMLQTGDWVVPRQQGQPLLSRPPLGSYPIALAAMALGDCSLFAVRLPTLLATWLTILLIYSYGRLFLSRLGALAAGLAYATMGQVLVLGRLAETEATFALLLSAALLFWHWGYIRARGAAWPWLAGYGLAALAALTKGPQAPIYFAVPATVFLICRRDWSMLLNRWHLAGIALFAMIVAAWQIPFWIQMGWPATKTVWLGDVAMRFEDTRLSTAALHLLAYPLECAACTLPWSPMLLCFLSRSFRRSLARDHSQAAGSAMFLWIAIGLAFASCWVVPGAKGRYFMPLYPCIALLVGLSIEQAARPAAEAWLRRGWRWFVLSKGALAIGAAVVIGAATWIGRLNISELAQPASFAVSYVVVAAAAAGVLIVNAGRSGASAMRISLLAITAIIGVSYVGVVINSTARAAEDPTPDVARLREKLPANARLVSFGLVETLFTYLYRQPIEERPWPHSASELDPRLDYFCFTWDRPVAPSLPFGWHIEAVIPCDRVRHEPPIKKVIVGRRIESLASRAD